MVMVAIIENCHVKTNQENQHQLNDDYSQCFAFQIYLTFLVFHNWKSFCSFVLTLAALFLVWLCRAWVSCFIIFASYTRILWLCDFQTDSVFAHLSCSLDFCSCLISSLFLSLHPVHSLRTVLFSGFLNGTAVVVYLSYTMHMLMRMRMFVYG